MDNRRTIFKTPPLKGGFYFATHGALRDNTKRYFTLCTYGPPFKGGVSIYSFSVFFQ